MLYISSFTTLFEMSLPWTKHCPENGQIHSTNELYCPYCTASRDATAPPARVIVDLTAPSGSFAPRTKLPFSNRVANVE
jgi:hypothetical protein